MVTPLRNGIIEYLDADFGVGIDPTTGNVTTMRGMCGGIAYATGLTVVPTVLSSRNAIQCVTDGLRLKIPGLSYTRTPITIYVHLLQATNDATVRTVAALGNETSTPSHRLRLYHPAGANNVGANGSGNSVGVSSGTGYSAGETVLGCCRDGTSLKLWVNGVLSTSTADSVASGLAVEDTLLIGHNVTSGAVSEPLSGIIRRVAIYGVSHQTTNADAIYQEWLNR